MFRYYSSYVLVFGGLTHLICCGLPIFLGLSSLFTNPFFIESLVFDFELLEVAENYLFTLTSVIFLILIFAEIYNKRKNCLNESCSSKTVSDSTKKKIRFNLILSTLLYFVNSVVFLSEKIT